MTRNFFTISFLLLFIHPTMVIASNQANTPLPTYSVVYDPSRDPFADGHAAIKLAQQTNRRVLIELGGDWCKWCHVMDRFFDDNPDIKAKLHETFVMLKINVSDVNGNEKFLASFPKPLGYPHMYVAEKNGNLLKSKDTAEFLINGRYSREAFLAFFDRWQIKPVEKAQDIARQ